ncbi:ABC transporter permease [Oliverpabstia intestinalis]|uniref:ABC transporter permease n=1 Tax=Oliverpabstia intestinalis TaxID=2606633 RepID=UPI003F8BF651
MSNKKKIIGILGILVLIVLNVLIIGRRDTVSGNYELHMTIKADKSQMIQVYYSQSGEVTDAMSQTIQYDQVGEEQELVYSIPDTFAILRLDLGNEPGSFEIDSMYMEYRGQKADIAQMENSKLIEGQQLESLELNDNILKIWTSGNDPFVWLTVSTETLYPVLASHCNKVSWIKNILMLVLLDGMAAFAIVFRKKVFHLPIELFQNRKLILNLAKNDFKTKYAGSYLGIVWAFVQPVVTIVVYWFVFSVGLKAGKASNYPFVLYLVSGIVPWFFFQDALNGGTNALVEYNYLVKKVVFKISILPIVKIISAFFVHVFFVAFALILCTIYGYLPGLATIQILYYSLCTFMLSLGLVYATSAIVVFFRDLTQIINIFLQVGIWLTPIMWDVQMMADYPWLMKIFRLNPMYYIVSGYRDSMLGKIWFWQHFGWTIYFWAVTIVLFGLGSVIFKRLKPHFADVL